MKERLKKVDTLLSEDYKIGFKEGVQKYIESKKQNIGE